MIIFYHKMIIKYNDNKIVKQMLHRDQKYLLWNAFLS